jgi:methionyl-tRNA formyltransferase
MQPKNLKDESFINELKQLNADLFIVVAFRMLPEVIWSMPPKGTINLHASLLPQYRGAAPINWAIINGEQVTGVTTFFIRQEIDTGHIIFQEKVTIHETDNAGTLHDKLMTIGANLILKTVQAIMEDKVVSVPQEELIKNISLKHAPKIFKETCRINWNNKALEVHNLIRGLSPYPAAFTTLTSTDRAKELMIKIYSSQIETALSNNILPGQINTDNKTYLKIACADNWLLITELQQSGKKKMNIAEFLRGCPLTNTYQAT